MQNEKHLPNVIDFFDLEPLSHTRSCITIGNFDGVHLGHQAIIRKMVRHAAGEQQPVIVVTFFPDPSDFFNPKREAFYLSTPSEKVRLLGQLGVDQVLTFHFTDQFSRLTAREFISVLVEKIGLDILVIGRDFALGKDREGTVPVIKSLGETMGFSVEIVERIELKEQEVSSTRIREFLAAGQVYQAAQLLGHPYFLSGAVTHGSDRGARIGLPTANIAPWPKKLLPAVGVYATRVMLEEKLYYGITNVGLRPTFEDQKTPNVETHILDFDCGIYGEELTLHFVQKIRDEQKFSGIADFLEQIERDKAAARKIFNHDPS
jgi:riboflavin kinase/FMN adenylyltransferase